MPVHSRILDVIGLGEIPVIGAQSVDARGRVSKPDRRNGSLSALPLRIAHVVLSLDCGGLEQIVLELVKGGRASDQQISVICLERPGTLAPNAEEEGATVHCMNKGRGVKWGLPWALARILVREQPDVIHTHQLGALVYAGLATYWRQTGVVIHTEHGKHYSNRWRTRLLGQFAARFARKVCCVSQDILEEVVAERVAPASKCDFVPNGIETSRFLAMDGQHGRAQWGIPSNAMVVGTVGRLTEVKQQCTLITAFAAALSETATPFHLVIVGEGPERTRLEQMAQGLGIHDRVTFTGYQSRPEEFLTLMDIFALTSRSEGMPLAVLEAWAAGLPIVATKVGGLPKLIEHERTGLLCEFDDVAGLASSFVRLAAERDFAQRLGKAGQFLVHRCYDVRVMRERYQQIYEQVLQEKGMMPCAFSH